MRAIDPVSAPGDYRVEADLDLSRLRAKPQLRSPTFASSTTRNNANPYDLQAINTVRSAPPVVARIFSTPALCSDGSAVATFKMSGGPHCHMKLALDGDTFVRHARIETGDTLNDLRTVSDSGIVYRIVTASLGSGSVERTDFDYPRSLATYLHG